MPPCDLSLVIPCYRDAPHLRAHVEVLRQTLAATRLSWEIILVNDASPDECGAIGRSLTLERPDEIRFLDHPRNTGRGQSVADGVRLATGRYAGFVDIDLEVPALYIPAMVARLEAGADVVCADRVYKLKLSILHRALLSRGYHAVQRSVLGLPLGDTEAGYKFFRRDAILPVLDQCQDRHWFWDTEIMVRALLGGLRVEYLPVLFLRRPDKASTVKLISDSVTHWRRLLELRRELRQMKQNGQSA